MIITFFVLSGSYVNGGGCECTGVLLLITPPKQKHPYFRFENLNDEIKTPLKDLKIWTKN